MGGVHESNPFRKGEEEVVNRAVYFLPQKRKGERPALVVAGAMVFGYIRDGELRVVVDLKEVSERLIRADDTVPLRVTVEGREVFRDESLPLLT